MRIITEHIKEETRRIRKELESLIMEVEAESPIDIPNDYWLAYEALVRLVREQNK